MAAPSAAIRGRAARLWRWQRRVRQERLPWLSLLIFAILLVCAVFAELLAPHDPRGINLLNTKLAPGEDWSFPLGTDVLGRDMLSRLVFGARTTVIISLVSLTAGAVGGTLLGLISGYFGRWVDVVIMRLADTALAFPTILVALLLVVFLGPGTFNIILAVFLTMWARFARMVRGDVLSVKTQDFVTLASALGRGARADAPRGP